MNCEESKNLLTVSVYGKLTPSEKRQLEEHLRGCPKCARIHEKSAKISSFFEEEEDFPLPDKEKSWQIISTKTLEKKAIMKVLFPYKKIALATFALLVVFILGFLAGKQILFRSSETGQSES